MNQLCLTYEWESNEEIWQFVVTLRVVLCTCIVRVSAFLFKTINLKVSRYSFFILMRHSFFVFYRICNLFSLLTCTGFHNTPESRCTRKCLSKIPCLLWKDNTNCPGAIQRAMKASAFAGHMLTRTRDTIRDGRCLKNIDVIIESSTSTFDIRHHKFSTDN